MVTLTFILDLYRGKMVVIYCFALNRTANSEKTPSRVSTILQSPPMFRDVE